MAEAAVCEVDIWAKGSASRLTHNFIGRRLQFLTRWISPWGCDNMTSSRAMIKERQREWAHEYVPKELNRKTTKGCEFQGRDMVIGILEVGHHIAFQE